MENLPAFKRGAIEPIECLKAGWALIKDRYWLFLGITVVGILIAGLVPLGILMGPMMCGIYLVLFQQMRGRPVEFAMLFRGFDYFVESLLATLIQFVPIFVLLVPFYVFFGIGLAGFVAHHRQAGGTQDTAQIVGLLAGVSTFIFVAIVVSFVIGILFAFTYPLIVDRKLKALPAIQTSMKAAMANFWPLLGLVLLNALLGMVGMFCCYIGAFLVTPVMLAGLAVAYRQIFGLNEESLPPAPPVS